MRGEKLKAVQGVRGLAIFLVFVSHCGYLHNSAGGTLLNFAGAAGVSVFFVLSGVLLMMRSIRGGSGRPFRTRVGNALQKLYPLHLLTFVAAIPLMIMYGYGVLYLLPRALCQLLLIQSWVPASSFYYIFNTPAWYLSTYLFLVAVGPWLVTAVNRFYLRASQLGRLLPLILALLLGGGIVLEAALTLIPLPFSWLHWIVYICPLVRCIDFVSGMILCRLLECANFELSPISQNVLFVGSLVVLSALIGVTVVCPGTRMCYYSAYWLGPALGLSAVGFLGGLRGISRLLLMRPIVWLGDVSLELFLTHWLIIKYAGIVFDLASHPVVSTMLLFAVSLAVAAAAHRVNGVFQAKLRVRMGRSSG